ncbi:MAG TPA: hypothetical protein VFS21_38390 [Roseiflexaceae bacterium]|nr:hypothetical protein [Roseiflexaceae bacterium]
MEDWRKLKAPPTSDPEARRRYNRVLRLRQFERDLETLPRVRRRNTDAQIAYRRRCLADPEAYIRGEIGPDRGGRQPKRDGE